jgi:TRAP-type uncharacterized transport system substrate-binding protein
MGAPLGLRFMGDWGPFNLSRICGWLAYEVWRQTGGAPSSVIHTGRGSGDNVRALARGDVDVAVATPAAFVNMAVGGVGPFAGAPMPNLRAVGCVPHDDALLFAIPAGLGISSMADLREKRPALRIACARDDGESFMGFGARALLRSSGIEPEAILEWGGSFVYGEDPAECVAHVASGAADAIIQEAIMTPWWRDLTESHDLAFLGLEPQAATALERDLSLTAVEVPPAYLRGIDAPLRAIDFSGWLVMVRDDMPDEIAGMLARAMVQSSDFFEAQYRHIPVRSSALTYPITPERLTDTRIPLHPGAREVYGDVQPGPLPFADGGYESRSRA